MQTLKKILTQLRHLISDNKGNLSSSRVFMFIILFWFIIDWALEVHSKGFYTLTWEKLTLLTSSFGLKTVQKFPETYGNYYPGNQSPPDQLPPQ